MNWQKCLYFVVIFPLLFPTQRANAKPPVLFAADIVIEDRPVLLGDVFYARVIFRNAGERPISVQGPNAAVTYFVNAGTSETPGGFDPHRILVTEFMAEDNSVGNRLLKPGESLSNVCMIRAAGNVSGERYPARDSLQLYFLGIEFDCDVSYSEIVNGKEPSLDSVERVTVRRVRRGTTLWVRVSGLAVDRYADFRAIHGGVEFGGHWEHGLLATDTLSRNLKKWEDVRAKLHPDSNLLRLIEFIENYQAVLKSDATDEQKFDLAVALLNDRRPMERDWLRPRLRNQLANDLSDVFYERQQKFQQGL